MLAPRSRTCGFPNCGPGVCDRCQGRVRAGCESGDQAGDHRVAGDPAEHLGMRPDLGDVGETVTTERQGRGQVEEGLLHE